MDENQKQFLSKQFLTWCWNPGVTNGLPTFITALLQNKKDKHQPKGFSPKFVLIIDLLIILQSICTIIKATTYQPFIKGDL